MILVVTIAHIAIAVVAGLACLVLGFAGRKPNDFVLACAGVVELLLIVQVVVSLVAPAFGNQPTGSLLEFWIYLVTAALIPVAAAFWALVDRNRWSTAIIGDACLAVAVMLYRMAQIWFVQVA